jgi:hypothetical protein
MRPDHDELRFSVAETRTQSATLPLVERDLLGQVTSPSGIVLVVDVGLLGMWSHLDPPLLDDRAVPEGTARIANSCVDYRVTGPDWVAATMQFGLTPGWLYDRPPDFSETFDAAMSDLGLTASLTPTRARVPHRLRVDHALAGDRRSGTVSFHGLWAPVIAGLPASTTFNVFGTRLGTGRYPSCWRQIELEVRSTKVATTEAVGEVSVDWARLAFVDVDALGAWQHDEPLDGKADFVFWGRDAAPAAKATSAPALEDGHFGWLDFPIDQVVERGTALEELREARNLKLAADFRPHSHHYLMMTQIRATDTESGTIEVGGAKMCGFMTTWGDGVFPVERDLDADGNLVAVRIVLATQQSVANMDAVNPSLQLNTSPGRTSRLNATEAAQSRVGRPLPSVILIRGTRDAAEIGAVGDITPRTRPCSRSRLSARGGKCHSTATR